MNVLNMVFKYIVFLNTHHVRFYSRNVLLAQWTLLKTQQFHYGMNFQAVFIYISAQQTFIIKHAFLEEETDLVSTCDEIVCISLDKHKIWFDRF